MRASAHTQSHAGTRSVARQHARARFAQALRGMWELFTIDGTKRRHLVNANTQPPIRPYGAHPRTHAHALTHTHAPKNSH